MILIFSFLENIWHKQLNPTVCGISVVNKHSRLGQCEWSMPRPPSASAVFHLSGWRVWLRSPCSWIWVQAIWQLNTWELKGDLNTVIGAVLHYIIQVFFFFLNYITSSYQFVTSRLGHNHPYTVKTVRVCFADNNNNHTIWCSLSKWFSELQINALKHSEMAGSNLTPKSKD